jgi:hypothetical protein
MRSLLVACSMVVVVDCGSAAAPQAPTRDISSVRRTDVVVCRGVVYAPAELFAAVGMRPR